MFIFLHFCSYFCIFVPIFVFLFIFLQFFHKCARWSKKEPSVLQRIEIKEKLLICQISNILVLTNSEMVSTRERRSRQHLLVVRSAAVLEKKMKPSLGNRGLTENRGV